MRKHLIRMLVALALIAGSPATLAHEAAGYWSGVLNGRIHLFVHLSKTPGGIYTGSIENTDNESGSVPFNAVVSTPPRLQLTADQVGGHFDGT